MKPFSLYIHIPYCLHKCPYCDFNTYAVSKAPEDDYVSALLAELDFRASQPEWSGRTVQSIYFGGGTPSLFHPRSFRRLIFFICKTFPVDSRVEITIEANPGTLSAENLAGYRLSGINRLSIGAQSFGAQTLKTLGRIHGVSDVVTAVEWARAADFTNLSLDLIYGVPGQSLGDFRRDLKEILELNPEHISSYGLTIEKGTEFYSMVKKGKLKPLQDETVILMMRELIDTVALRGYKHYEISNFAKDRREARHNMAYWNGDDYLGLGAGAHSMLSSGAQHRIRWSNMALPAKYMEAATSHGRADSWQDTLETRELMFEFFFLGLRKMAGVSLNDFKSRFGFSAFHAYPGMIEILIEKGFLKHDQDLLALTAKGLMVADSVIENFIYDRAALPESRPQLPEDLSYPDYQQVVNG